MKVTAAIICNDDKVLLCQRPKEKRYGLLWEFPGGKVEPNESEEDCIVRECNEELDIVIKILQKFDVVDADDVSITYFKAVIDSGEIRKNEHNDIRWVGWKDLNKYDLCPNDNEMITRHVTNLKEEE